MPDVDENLRRMKLVEIRRMAIKGSRLWVDLIIAAEAEDPEKCRKLWDAIRSISIDVFKALETFKPQPAEVEGGSNG